MKNRLRLDAVAMLVVALCYAVSTTANPSTTTKAALAKAELGSPAPQFALPDCYNKPFFLNEFKGKVVVLEWVNQRCPISMGAHREGKMQAIYKKYAGQGVVWLGIDSSHFADKEANRIHAAQMSITYPILNDPEGKVGKAYQAKTTPHMFIIDKAGNLVYDGAIDDQGEKNYVVAALDEILAGKPVSKPKTKPYGCTVKYKTPK